MSQTPQELLDLLDNPRWTTMTRRRRRFGPVGHMNVCLALHREFPTLETLRVAWRNSGDFVDEIQQIECRCRKLEPPLWTFFELDDFHGANGLFLINVKSVGQ